MSSWPTCTPSAPARRPPGRAVVDDQQGADALAQGTRSRWPAATSSSSRSVLLAQLDDVDPAGAAPRSSSGRCSGPLPPDADQVQPGAAQALAPLESCQRSSPAVWQDGAIGSNGPRARRHIGLESDHLASSAGLTDNQASVVVVGGGSSAWPSPGGPRRRGLRVTVLERDEPGGGTSRVAAGMLAPVAEVELAARSRCWISACASARCGPSSSRELEQSSGLEIGLIALRHAAGRPRRATRPPRSSASWRFAALAGSGRRAAAPQRGAARWSRRWRPRCGSRWTLPDDHAVDPRGSRRRWRCRRRRRWACARAHRCGVAVCSPSGRVERCRAGRRRARCEAEAVVARRRGRGPAAAGCRTRAIAAAPRQGPDHAPARSRPGPAC